MNNNKQEIEALQQIDQDQDYNAEKMEIIELSYKDSESNNSYPSLGSNSVNLLRNSQDQVDDVSRKIQRSSLKQEGVDESYSASFSSLNSSIKEEEVGKSNRQSKLKQIQEEEQSINEKEMQMLNQSMFTSRLGKNPLAKQYESPYKQAQESINYERSFYMTERPPVPAPAKEKKKSSPKPQKINKQEIKVSFISKAYLLQLKELNIQANKSTLHSLYHELFKKEIFVPRFNFERYDEWQAVKDQNKYSLQCDAHMNFKVYLEKYINYLNQCRLAQIEQVFKNLEQMQQLPSDRSLKNQNFSIFNIGSLLENFKSFMNSSKYEILRKTLLAKIKSLKAMLKQKLVWKLTAEDEEQIQESIRQTWNDLAKVEMLRNFQDTDEYCSKQMENSSELKFKQIWVKYKEANRREKDSFISQVDSIHL